METNFKLFDPQIDAADKLPDSPGNYFLVLRTGCQLPQIGISPTFTQWEHEGKSYNIIYTGISSKSLKKRDYAQHFTGNNAGRSTLRKSLGSMMGFPKIPRDKKKPENGKTKFNDQDEEQLSQWMKHNLLLFYKACDAQKIKEVKKEIEKNEKKYIGEYNPPLNIQGNTNEINKDFRKALQILRK